MGLLCLLKDDSLKQSDVSTVADFWYGNRKCVITVANTVAESEHKSNNSGSLCEDENDQHTYI